LLDLEQEYLFTYILWIIAPEAKTTSEKLEMTGEPVNISNIEKKSKRNENVSQKFKMETTTNTVTNKNWCQSGKLVGDFIMTVLRFSLNS
jgi:hypothetical protein